MLPRSFHVRSRRSERIVGDDHLRRADRLRRRPAVLEHGSQQVCGEALAMTDHGIATSCRELAEHGNAVKQLSHVLEGCDDGRSNRVDLARRREQPLDDGFVDLTHPPCHLSGRHLSSRGRPRPGDQTIGHAPHRADDYARRLLSCAVGDDRGHRGHPIRVADGRPSELVDDHGGLTPPDAPLSA
jgi:hypothetical protein